MQNNIINFLLLISIAFIFNACVGSQVSARVDLSLNQKTMPAWISSPLPSDNENFLYGMSVEADRDSAIKAALSDMVAKLGTTIESSYESSQEVQGAYSNLIVKNKIKSDISKIKINNYKVIKSHKVSYREFAVMVETDKRKFVKGLKENLEIEKKKIDQEINFVKESDALSRYKTKKELSSKAYELLPSILIIAQLDKAFNKSENLEFISKKQKEFSSESKRLKFYVSGDSRSEKFIDTVKNHLAHKGYNVTNSKRDAVEIKINTSDNINKGHFIDIAVINLQISVFENSKRIGGKSLILKERFNNSKNSVYKNASIHFEQDIKSLGISDVIGIELD